MVLLHTHLGGKKGTTEIANSGVERRVARDGRRMRVGYACDAVDIAKNAKAREKNAMFFIYKKPTVYIQKTLLALEDLEFVDSISANGKNK